MTVRQLIDALTLLPPDLEVRVWDPSEGVSFPPDCRPARRL